MKNLSMKITFPQQKGCSSSRRPRLCVREPTLSPKGKRLPAAIRGALCPCSWGTPLAGGHAADMAEEASSRHQPYRHREVSIQISGAMHLAPAHHIIPDLCGEPLLVPPLKGGAPMHLLGIFVSLWLGGKSPLYPQSTIPNPSPLWNFPPFSASYRCTI